MKTFGLPLKAFSLLMFIGWLVTMSLIKVYDDGRHKGYRECLSEQDDDFPKPRSNQN